MLLVVRALHPGRAVLGAEVEQDQRPRGIHGLDQLRHERVASRIDPVEIVQEEHGGLPLAARVHLPPDPSEEPALARAWIGLGRGPGRVRYSEEVPEERQVGLERAVEQEQPARDLLARGLSAVPLVDAEVRAQELVNGQQRNRLAVRGAVGLVDGDLAAAAALRELVAEPALAHAGLADHTHHAPLPFQHVLQRRVERRELVRAADQAREAACPRHVHPRPHRAHPDELEDLDRVPRPLHWGTPQRRKLEVALDQMRRALGHADAARLGQRLHALRQAHRVTLRGVVHAQVVADLADHDLARVQPDSHAEVEPAFDAQLVRVVSHLVPQPECRVARPLGMVFVRDRRAEQRHDAVARVLVHRSLEAVDTFGQDREEALQDRVPDLGVQPLRQIHRALHVREQHRDLLALPLESGPRLEDLVGEVLGGVGAGGALGSLRVGGCERMSAGVTELLAHRVVLTAGRTRSLGYEGRCALSAECSTLPILVAAARAIQSRHSRTTLPASAVSWVFESGVPNGVRTGRHRRKQDETSATASARFSGRGATEGNPKEHQNLFREQEVVGSNPAAPTNTGCSDRIVWAVSAPAEGVERGSLAFDVCYVSKWWTAAAAKASWVVALSARLCSSRSSRPISSSTLATMRCCSASGGSGTASDTQRWC